MRHAAPPRRSAVRLGWGEGLRLLLSGVALAVYRFLRNQSCLGCEEVRLFLSVPLEYFLQQGVLL